MKTEQEIRAKDLSKQEEIEKDLESKKREQPRHDGKFGMKPSGRTRIDHAIRGESQDDQSM